MAATGFHHSRVPLRTERGCVEDQPQQRKAIRDPASYRKTMHKIRHHHSLYRGLLAVRMKFEIHILAGGLSTRLGQDKARLRFGRRTMLSIIRDEAAELGYPVRVIRRDLVARCGPLGGIFTGLKTSRADAVLFLACDMPLVAAKLLRRLVRASGAKMQPVIVAQDNRVGFPFILPRTAMADIESQISEKEFSMHALAAKIKARTLRVPMRSNELLNVNNVEDAKKAAELVSERR